jgi:hypothetical protein
LCFFSITILLSPKISPKNDKNLCISGFLEKFRVFPEKFRDSPENLRGSPECSSLLPGAVLRLGSATVYRGDCTSVGSATVCHFPVAEFIEATIGKSPSDTSTMLSIRGAKAGGHFDYAQCPPLGRCASTGSVTMLRQAQQPCFD